MCLARHFLSPELFLQVRGRWNEFLGWTGAACVYYPSRRASKSIANHVFVIESISSCILHRVAAARVLVAFGSKPTVVVAAAEYFQTHNHSLMVRKHRVDPAQVQNVLCAVVWQPLQLNAMCFSLLISVNIDYFFVQGGHLSRKSKGKMTQIEIKVISERPPSAFFHCRGSFHFCFSFVSYYSGKNA